MSDQELTGTDYVPRITQVDSCNLDNAIHKLLKQQFLKCFQYWKPGVIDRFDPEINAMLRFIVWKFSIYLYNSTLGQQLLRVKYASHTQNKAYLYAALLIGLNYTKDRQRDLLRLIQKPTWKEKMTNLLEYIQTFIQIAALLNLLVFLQQGKYPSLLDRILQLRPISAKPGSHRKVNYKYIHRELLWLGFTELLMAVIPLVNFHRLKNWLKAVLPWQVEKKGDQKNCVFDVTTKCSICGDLPLLPHQFGCTHIACYYCIKSNYLADPNYICQECNYQVQGEWQIVPIEMKKD